jgi:predicted TIM-barrel fold metal-dependent hydrolase
MPSPETATLPYPGPVIDSDMHHTWCSDEDVIAYLPKRWQDYVRADRGLLRIDAAVPTYPHIHGPNKRLDTFPPSGGPPGSDYETMRKQFLEPFRIERAILSFDVGGNSGLPNVYFATEIVRAINDWNIDHWLSIDDERLHSVVLVPTQDPERAAKEIRRVGGHPKVAEVLLVANGLRRPFGDPLYHPIYEAAVEMGLPVAIHAFGGDGAASIVAGGVVGSRLEFHTCLPQSAVHYLTSFITNGVFEKYCDLKLVIVELGVGWAPWLLWALDGHYEILRSESRWVRRRPSEYFREHVRMTTQPMEMSDRPARFVEALVAFGGMDDILCFATDYPHWDTDDPMFIARRLPAEWLPKVFASNARALYGWRNPSVEAGSGGGA